MSSHVRMSFRILCHSGLFVLQGSFDVLHISLIWIWLGSLYSICVLCILIGFMHIFTIIFSFIL
ncbi:hypothetical protein C8J57DRAFT_1344898 [Mycena rebaudengoi]|nr:hypothetical protein C8J57DRAFT_1344898 [Mycena rebaudengoi]